MVCFWPQPKFLYFFAEKLSIFGLYGLKFRDVADMEILKKIWRFWRGDQMIRNFREWQSLNSRIQQETSINFTNPEENIQKLCNSIFQVFSPPPHLFVKQNIWQPQISINISRDPFQKLFKHRSSFF